MKTKILSSVEKPVSLLVYSTNVACANAYIRSAAVFFSC